MPPLQQPGAALQGTTMSVTHISRSTGASDWSADDWIVGAGCAQTDPELFFPDKGGSATTARGICRRCPVTEHCLQDALDTNDIYFGIRAGYSPRQRKLLVRASESRGAA